MHNIYICSNMLINHYVITVCLGGFYTKSLHIYGKNGYPSFENSKLLIAIPLKMYSKLGQPKLILVSQILKLHSAV